MARNRSQVYDVDNRYSQTEGASDNDAGKSFNAYGRASYKNQFKAEQAKNKEYTSIEDTEKTDYRTSLGELVSENIRSIYKPDSKYTENVRKQYYSR
jgi:hypothetical protein